ncbi:putative aminohydrolase SsnA [Propionibacterium sp.]|uniref:putative aminohydrolase SsnA n=1 Tax=Propionibacterium sp. TaxID=1977903 RepID=UPI0039E98985
MIIGNGRLFTNDPQNLFFENGAVLVEGDEIKAVGDTSGLKAAHPDEKFFDVEGRVIMPGLINAHTHAYSAYARGCAPAAPQRNFMELLENLWWRLDRLLTLEDVELNAYTTFKESIRNGVTTVIDHHSSPNAVAGSLDTIAQAARTIGIRASLCYEASDRDGADIFAEQIAENVAFMAKANTGDQDMVHGLFGLHASFTLSQDSLERCATAAENVNGGFHVHVAEGGIDEIDSQTRYGKPIVDRFAELGMLGPQSIAVHCIHADLHEAEQLMVSDTNVVHNPQSNMGNAVGAAPVADWLHRGIRIGLGTDAYTADMLTSMQVAKVLASHTTADPTVGFGQSIQMLFENNPLICANFFAKGLGRIKPGYHSDLITLNYHPYTPLNAETIFGHLLFGMNGAMVNDTMINGQWVMRDRELTTIDEAAIDAHSAERASTAIWPNM